MKRHLRDEDDQLGDGRMSELGDGYLLLQGRLSVDESVVAFDEADDLRFELQWKFTVEMQYIGVLEAKDCRTIGSIEKGFEQLTMRIVVQNS